MPRYLVSSSSPTTGGVLIFDSSTLETRWIFRGPSRGMTRAADGCYYLVSGYRNIQDGNSQVHRIHPGMWAVEHVGEYPIADCHDIRWFKGHLYVVASLGNQIVRLDEQFRILDRMQVVQDDRDICHANCLMELNGELYCSIFTLTPGERAEKRLTGAWHTEGKILKLDYERRSFEIFYEPLGQPHSLVHNGTGIYLVESHRSCITRVDVKTRQAQQLRQYLGFMRGLSVSADEVVAGVCVMYHRDRKRLQPLTRFKHWIERKMPFSGLMVLDPKTLRVRRRVKLDGAEVYDILRLGGDES